MKSFFLKVSLLAGLSLSGFCSVFAQTKTEVINTYLKVTNEKEFFEKGIYIVASLEDDYDSTVVAIMSGHDDKNQRSCLKVSKDSVQDKMIYLSSNLIAEDAHQKDKVYELETHKDNYYDFLYFFDIANKQYLQAEHSDKINYGKAYLTLISSVPTNKKDKSLCAVYVSFQDNGECRIEFNPLKLDDTFKKLKYNGSKHFSCYRGVTSGMHYAQLYRKVIPITMKSEGYSTLCADYAFKMPEGLTGGIVKSVDGTNLTIDYCYPTDSIVPAHTPIILKGAENTYNASVMSVEGNTYEGNYLYATVDTEGNTSVDGDKDNKYRYYKLAKYNNEVGFWWNAEGGGPFKNGKNKAYLALKRNSGVAEVKGFTLEGLEQTGITNATTQENATSTAVYDLNGKLMPQTQTRSLPAGVYIINGKVTILKNNR